MSYKFIAEYEDWINAYSSYLVHMYEKIFFPYMNRQEKKTVTFDSFCKFVYEQSSGDIYEYS